MSPTAFTRFVPADADNDRTRLSADTNWGAVYDDLRNLASQYLAQRPPGHTLQATALVNEAFVKLGTRPDVRSREHFLALAATTMRHVLVDHARGRGRDKRGGGRERVTLDRVGEVPELDFDVLAVEESLSSLAASNERQARVVELRIFGGLSVAETASVLEVSERTVKTDWRIARAWLVARLAAE